MLKLTKKTDYALMAMNHIAYLSERRLVNAKEVAEAYQIPVEMMAKILQSLARDGILVSGNGPKGGYALSRSPEQVSVAEVIASIEGPIRMADCIQQTTATCLQADHCTIRTPVEYIQDQMYRLLDGMSLADLHAISCAPVVMLNQ